MMFNQQPQAQQQPGMGMSMPMGGQANFMQQQQPQMGNNNMFA